MNVRVIPFLCLVLLGIGASAVADADGDALAQRFLAHMDAIPPVAGTFTIETRYEPDVRAADIKAKNEWAASQGFRLNYGQEKPLLRCEWAWDGTYESLKALEGSNKFDQFYSSPEALLRGMAADNYNLTGPSLPPTWRPATFYLLGGAAPWSKYLSDLRFSTQNAPDDAPPGSIILVGQSETREVRLLIDEETGMLHGHKLDLRGQPYSRLVVDRLERSPDGRVFPAQALLTIFLKGQPYQFITLTAERITFRPAEVARAMQMVLPPGTRIHDRVLNRVIPITRPTPVESVLADQMASEPPEEPSPVVSLPTPAQTQTTVNLSTSGSAWRRSGWFLGGIAALAAIGAWSFLRGGRMWDRSRPGRS